MVFYSFRLYCTWHVDQTWHKNLCNIDSKDNQITAYKQLRTLLHERDPSAFMIMVNNFVTSLLSDKTTIQFRSYFRDHYLKSTAAWAYYYRLNAGPNKNMHIERMRSTLKYLYLHGKVVKRLDKALMKFVRDKLFDRLIILNKEKISTKVKEIRSRHRTSETLDINSVLANEMGWTVPSQSSQEIYSIEKRLAACDCKLICTGCGSCILLHVR